ncbi:MAG: helix-turn-helix domain-containing protein [Bacteroidaceae bacterium]|nr:helix-turn-helix domain-containing protein [Bacteroidaceae bacterium]
MRRIVLFFISLLTGFAAQAQLSGFRHLTVSDGLVGMQINCFCKDSHGFMWIGTETGISCYDGLSFTNYQSHYQDPTALPDNRIESIQEDSEGTLWIRSNESYVVMDPVTRLVDRAVSQRLSMLGNNLEPSLVFVDKNANLWVYVKNKSVFYYKMSQRLIYEFEQGGDNPVLPPTAVTGFANTPDGMLAVFEDGTVVCLNAENQSVLWTNSQISQNIQECDNYHIFQDKARNMWVYGENHLFFYDASLGQWYRSLGQFSAAFGMSDPIEADMVKGVSADANGKVWVVTERNGLFSYMPEERSSQRFIANRNRSQWLTTDFLQSVYADDGAVWVGSQRQGLHFGSPYMFTFSSARLGDLNGISLGTDSTLWMATRDRGLVHYWLTDSHYESMNRQQGLCDDGFSCVLQAKDGSVWAGSNRSGISRLMGTQVKSYHMGAGLSDNHVQALTEDIFGNIWIGTKNGGLHCYSAKTGEISTFNRSNGKLPSNNVTSIHSRKNQLLVGTGNGIVLANLSRNEFKTITSNRSASTHLTSNVVTAVYIDARGVLWVGTTEGLNLIDLQNDNLTVFTMSSHGLPSNIINGITSDRNNDLWVTTDAGVCCIRLLPDPKNPMLTQYAISNYTKDDGLQNENFNRGAICAAKDGGLYLGTPFGLSWMEKRRMAKTENKYQLLFSSLYVNDVKITDKNGSKIIPCVLNSCNKITLSHAQNDVRILVTLSSYANKARRPRFTYLLEDGSTNGVWKPIRSDGHTIHLADLSPGKYRLHVKAADEDGKSIADERVMEISVAAVWYKTWPFYISVVVLLLLIAYVVLRAIPYIRTMYFTRLREITDYRRFRKQLEEKITEIRQEAILIAPKVGLLQMEVEDSVMRERLQDIQHVIRGFVSKLSELREDKSLRVTKSVNDTIGEDLLIEANEGSVNEGVLISDDGVVQGNAFVDSQGEIVQNSSQVSMFLVDVDPDMLDFMADCLKNRFTISTFTDIDVAWEAIQEHQPDVVVCAHELTKGTGSELCHRIRNERTMENLPFVLTLAKSYSLTEMDTKKVTMMADDYIPQPMNLNVLTQRVYRMLDISFNQTDEIKGDETSRAADMMTMSVKLQLRKYVDDYVMQNISRKDLTIDELSRVLGISRTVLFRRIEMVTGRVPADYIRAVRLQEVSKLISTGSFTLSELATKMGFVNGQTLSYYFKLEYGVLPTEYMEMALHSGAGGSTQR